MKTVIKNTSVAVDPTGRWTPVGEPTDRIPVLAARLLEIGTRCAALPLINSRSADEIIGYDAQARRADFYRGVSALPNGQPVRLTEYKIN